ARRSSSVGLRRGGRRGGAARRGARARRGGGAIGFRAVGLRAVRLRYVALGAVGLGGRLVRRGFLGLPGLLARLGRIVGDVPALALEDEGSGRQEAAHRATAGIARGQRRRGDALAPLEDAMTSVALVFVRRHE